MILFVHLLFGAAIGSTIKNIPLAIVLAFLGHYFLDLLPHVDYSVENIKNKQKMLLDFAKVALDIFCGVLLIFIFSKNQPIIYVCAFFAVIPDGLSAINYFIPNKILTWHARLHTEKIHFLRNKKISNFWRITSQVIVVVVSLILLKF